MFISVSFEHRFDKSVTADSMDNELKTHVYPVAGLYEKKNVWNRIRVDENGYVICSEDGKD